MNCPFDRGPIGRMVDLVRRFRIRRALLGGVVDRVAERTVIAVGIAGPVPSTRALVALCDGLLLP